MGKWGYCNNSEESLSILTKLLEIEMWKIGHLAPFQFQLGQQRALFKCQYTFSIYRLLVKKPVHLFLICGKKIGGSLFCGKIICGSPHMWEENQKKFSNKIGSHPTKRRKGLLKKTTFRFWKMVWLWNYRPKCSRGVSKTVFSIIPIN